MEISATVWLRNDIAWMLSSVRHVVLAWWCSGSRRRTRHLRQKASRRRSSWQSCISSEFSRSWIRRRVRRLTTTWRPSTTMMMWVLVDVLWQTSLNIKVDRPLTRDTLNAPWLLTNRQFQWTGNCHSQLPLAEVGKWSPNIDLLRTTGSNGRA